MTLPSSRMLISINRRQMTFRTRLTGNAFATMTRQTRGAPRRWKNCKRSVRVMPSGTGKMTTVGLEKRPKCGVIGCKDWGVTQSSPTVGILPVPLGITLTLRLQFFHRLGAPLVCRVIVAKALSVSRVLNVIWRRLMLINIRLDGSVRSEEHTSELQ